MPIYPLVNEIPLQETIATVYFDASGNLRIFKLKDPKVNTNNLPSATGQVKQLAVDFLGLNKEKLFAASARQSEPGNTTIVHHTLEDSGRHVVVSVEEGSGSLLSISSETIGKLQETSLATRAEAKKQALQFIESHLTLPAGTYTLQERFPAGEESGWALNKHLPAEYERSMIPIVKGVMAAKPLTSVTVDLHGNMITAVKNRTISSNTPAPFSLISEEQAKQALLDDVNIELNYVRDEKNGRSTLVYVPSDDLDGRYVVATTGKLGWKKGW